MRTEKYRIGTRKSQLATTQSTHFLLHLAHKGIEAELVFIDSEGDRNRTSPLHQVNPQSPGIFTKQLEQALSNNEIDLAVHSLKDVPTDRPEGLRLIAISKRENPRDVLIAHPSCRDPEGPLGISALARVGTSSLRREAALKSINPTFTVVGLRGNVPTRVEAVRSNKVQATVLAAAGLSRLGLDLRDLHVVELDENQMVPAPGQGALAVECRIDIDKNLEQAALSFHDLKTAEEVGIERQIMKELEGGCSLPLGVRCFQKAQGFKVCSFLGVRNEENQWIALEHFELEGSEAAVISQTVSHFRKILGRAGSHA